MSVGKWAFVTGASSGIGRAAVERLVRDGWQVIAGVRNDGDQPQAATAHVLVDVADAKQVIAATEQVAELCGGRLDALVNNAGITVAGPFDGLTVEDFRRQFDVNFFGVLDVTSQLLPALLAARGRIVTVGSIGGRFATPFLAPYNSSKFAIRGWNDALRGELAPHGVGVTLVEPGSVATPIWGKGNAQADALEDRLTPEQTQRWAKQMAAARKLATEVERRGIAPEKAAAAIARALTARRAPAHLVVGADARLQSVLATLPASAGDGFYRLMLRPPRD